MLVYTFFFLSSITSKKPESSQCITIRGKKLEQEQEHSNIGAMWLRRGSNERLISLAIIVFPKLPLEATVQVYP